MPDHANEIETVAECVRIPACHGQLEGVLTYPEDDPVYARALIVGPHPLLGGDMENNVVLAVVKMLTQVGFATLRFNYAGVGRSDGQRQDDASHMETFWRTSHVDDEPERWHDLDAAARFLESVADSSPLAAVGYSFGCSVISRWLQQQNAVEAIVCIAPTIGRHDYEGLANSSARKIILASRQDFATEAEAVTEAVARWKGMNNVTLADLDDHFFRGCEGWLREQIVPFLEESITRRSA